MLKIWGFIIKKTVRSPLGQCGTKCALQSLRFIWKPVKNADSQIFQSPLLHSHGLYRPWNSPGQNTRVGSLSLLQGIFPTQESNQGLLHCRRVLYQLSYQGSPEHAKPWLTPTPNPHQIRISGG